MNQQEDKEKIMEENKACVFKVRGMLHSVGKSITEMEVDLGFGNGSVGKWAKGVRRPPLERLVKIANYLGTTVAEIYPSMGEDAQMPATTADDGRYGLSPAYWKQIGVLFNTRLASIPKAPAYLATEQTGLSAEDVDAFLAGTRYVTKAQIHAMADRMGIRLEDIIGGLARAFDGPEDADIAEREEINRMLDAAPEWLREQVSSLLRAYTLHESPRDDGQESR